MGQSREDYERSYKEITGNDSNPDWSYRQLQQEVKALKEPDLLAETETPPAEETPPTEQPPKEETPPTKQPPAAAPVEVGTFVHEGKQHPLRQGKLHGVVLRGVVRYLSEASLRTIRGVHREELTLPKGSLISLPADTGRCKSCGKKKYKA